MPSKTSKKKAAVTLPAIPKDIIDQFVSGPMTAEAVNAASMAFKKALIERALGAELSHHLGYHPGADKPPDSGNHRNGVSGKTVLTDDGPLKIDVPRDRAGSFEPVLIPQARAALHRLRRQDRRHVRAGNDDEIQGFLREQYGTDVSPEFISTDDAEGTGTDVRTASGTRGQGHLSRILPAHSCSG
jgi:putative transposase